VSSFKKKLIAGATVVLMIILIVIGCRSVSQPVSEDPDEIQQPATGGEQVNLPKDDQPDIIEEVDVIEDEYFRAVWVPSVMNLDFPSRQGLTAMALMREIDTIVARTSYLGFNAIILQVRPTGDSFYQSDIFPWSHWLSGTQGQGIEDFDPLSYWIEACHYNNIELHAWLNPYRIIHTSTNSSDPNILSPDNPVYQNPELAVGWTTRNGNKGLFLDPGLPEARQLIIDGIAEIASGYDVDGIHIDDYFYPGTSFDDSASYERYGNGLDLADWRRDNVNTLIKGIQNVIHDVNEKQDKNIRWGISPTAIWKNGSSDPLGVPTTRGQESYHELYADTRLWVTEGWIDYICPQIYWYIGFETANFEPVLNWWEDLCKEYDIDLYVGHAAYREYQDDQPPNWHGEMIRQLEMTESSEIVKGNVFYRYHSLKGELGETIRAFYVDDEDIPEREPVMILDSLSVGMPEVDTRINATAANAPGFNIVGTSLPGLPLFMNGEEVTNRTIEGFFHIFAPLDSGENEFTFSQEGQEDVIRKITRSTSGSGGGGGGGSGTGTVTAVTTPRYAIVTSGGAWLFPANSITGGSDQMLAEGQRDRVIAESSNNYVKLSCGMWVNKNTVTLRTETALTENILRSGVYRAGTNYDILAWQSDIFPAIHADYDGSVLTLNFGMHTEVPPLNIPALSQTIFSEHSSGINNGIPYHKFTIKDNVKFEGYFAEFTDNEFRFNLKKRKPLTRGDKPLTGITIVLDPGHGGEFSGAIGPLGSEFAEKHLNLINSVKLAGRLEELGATVHLTRDSDVDISLQERTNISWQYKPDLFISLHINSVSETTNSENIRGFTVWYRNPNAKNISQTILDVMYDINPATTRHRTINQGNLFVCRPSWTPSVLLEAGFIINIDDFVWLIDPEKQDKMADATVEAILEYFAG